VDDELRLTAFAFQGSHGQSCGMRRKRGLDRVADQGLGNSLTSIPFQQ